MGWMSEQGHGQHAEKDRLAETANTIRMSGKSKTQTGESARQGHRKDDKEFWRRARVRACIFAMSATAAWCLGKFNGGTLQTLGPAPLGK